METLRKNLGSFRKKCFRYLKKGNGELFGFIALAPLMVSLMSALIGVVQVASFKEKLEYTAYVACRAAAVSETRDDALDAAKKAAQADLLPYSTEYTGEVGIDLSYAGSGHEWKKGSYVTCKVTVNARPMIQLMQGKTISSEMTMAIEVPDVPGASGGGGGP